MTCEHFQTTLGDFGDAAHRERAACYQHASGCPACQRLLDERQAARPGTYRIPDQLEKAAARFDQLRPVLENVGQAA